MEYRAALPDWLWSTAHFSDIKTEQAHVRNRCAVAVSGDICNPAALNPEP